MVTAVQQFLRNLITTLLMDRGGYRLRDNRVPVAIGVDCPNPWLLNTQQRAKTGLAQVLNFQILLCIVWRGQFLCFNNFD
jgi:hypothetical protein